MGDKTKIDWCDASWNPVTGCLHGCEYCYARRIAERFKGGSDFKARGRAEPLTWEVDDPGKMPDGRRAAYPFGFDPTFHRYRLDEPQRWTKPRTIFVCSMADLFGDWVPDAWIREVYQACAAAPQHRYLFLTKNPARVTRLMKNGILMPNTIDWWYGYTIDGERELSKERPIGLKTFCSVEPLLRCPDAKMLDQIAMTNWCIIGAETGNRKEKVIPEKRWIDLIANRCRDEHISVFMKESLRGIMGEDFRQEFPWEV